MYLNKITQPLTGASGVTLTASYSDNITSEVYTANCDMLVLEVRYTQGSGESGNSLQIRIEEANPVGGVNFRVTPTPTDWYQSVTETIASGTITEFLAERSFTAVSAAGTYDHFAIPIPIASKFIRFAIKETGIATNGGMCALKVTLREVVSK